MKILTFSTRRQNSLNGVLDDTTTANTRGRSSRAHARFCKFTSGSRSSSSRRPILRSLVFRRWRKLATFPDIEAYWRLAIRVLNSGVIHGGSLRWTLDFTAGMIASRPAVMSHSCLERSSILGAESKMDQSTAEKNRPSSAFLLARVSRLEINFLLGPARDGLFLVRTMTTLYNVIYI